jgi:large subunit ribosomal protein L6
MSRIAKKPTIIPENVEVKKENSNVRVKGPLGELSLKLHPDVELIQGEKELSISLKEKRTFKKAYALQGTFKRLVDNMILGVVSGFEKKLEISGIGYKAQVSGDKLILNIGFSHPVEFPIPQDIKITAEGNVITVSGIDKQKVGHAAAEIRGLRPVEPYKGKGIKYAGEVVKRKAGKQVKSSTA